MRVLYLVPARGLADPNTAREASVLADAGHEVSIVGPRGRTVVSGILDLVYRAPRIARKAKADAILCRDLDTLWAAIRAKRRTGAKVVYWPHDVYQDMVATDVPSAVVRLLDRHEKRLILAVDAAVASNEGVRKHLMERCLGLFPALVMPCRVPEMYFSPHGMRQLCYLGTLHKNRFIREMVEAMPAIREGFDEPKPTLVIAGPRDRHGIYDWLQRDYGRPVGGFDDEPVMFLGTITEDEVLHETWRSDVVVSMLNPADRCLRVGLANKVFDAMAVGRAAISTRGTATGDLIAETGMGLTPPYNVGMYVAAIRHMLENDIVGMGKNAYYAGKTKYNWNIQAEKLVKVFEELK